MAKKALVIVESPSKAKTIQKYLGREYIVKASVGHIMDLPKNKLGVDPDKGFKPEYVLIPGKKKVLEELKKAYDRVPVLYLATDPDREGEAIAWHIQVELKTKGKKSHRVLFNSVTKKAVIEAIEHPVKLDENKFNAQQARRILDRLVGYKISPLLWDKVRRGISAGRVQSVALRLIVEREAEVKAFKPEEYWKIKATFSKDGIEFPTRLYKVLDKDPELKSKKDVDSLLKTIEGEAWTIKAIEKRERSRKPLAPFITSRMQQDAASKLGFSAKKTMTLAQKLYEGIDMGDLGTSGLITYMRTDSVRIEPTALESVRKLIEKTYGKEFLPATPVEYKSRKSAQDAHEAIRPTSLEFLPEIVKPFLDKDEFRLYQLIWNRFVACQMNPAIYDQTTVDVEATPGGKSHLFRASGSVVKFLGFTAVYAEAEESTNVDDEPSVLQLPHLALKDSVKNEKFDPTQHFT